MLVLLGTHYQVHCASPFSLPLIHLAHRGSPFPVVATAEKRYGLSTLCEEGAHSF